MDGAIFGGRMPHTVSQDGQRSKKAVYYYTKRIGDTLLAGLALLAGSPTAQRETLEEWLPRIRPRPIPIPRREDPDD